MYMGGGGGQVMVSYTCLLARCVSTDLLDNVLLGLVDSVSQTLKLVKFGVMKAFWPYTI